MSEVENAGRSGADLIINPQCLLCVLCSGNLGDCVVAM